MFGSPRSALKTRSRNRNEPRLWPYGQRPNLFPTREERKLEAIMKAFDRMERDRTRKAENQTRAKRKTPRKESSDRAEAPPPDEELKAATADKQPKRRRWNESDSRLSAGPDLDSDVIEISDDDVEAVDVDAAADQADVDADDEDEIDVVGDWDCAVEVALIRLRSGQEDRQRKAVARREAWARYRCRFLAWKARAARKSSTSSEEAERQAGSDKRRQAQTRFAGPAARSGRTRNSVIDGNATRTKAAATAGNPEESVFVAASGARRERRTSFCLDGGDRSSDRKDCTESVGAGREPAGFGTAPQVPGLEREGTANRRSGAEPLVEDAGSGWSSTSSTASTSDFADGNPIGSKTAEHTNPPDRAETHVSTLFEMLRGSGGFCGPEPISNLAVPPKDLGSNATSCSRGKTVPEPVENVYLRINKESVSKAASDDSNCKNGTEWPIDAANDSNRTSGLNEKESNFWKAAALLAEDERLIDLMKDLKEATLGSDDEVEITYCGVSGAIDTPPDPDDPKYCSPAESESAHEVIVIDSSEDENAMEGRSDLCGLRRNLGDSLKGSHVDGRRRDGRRGKQVLERRNETSSLRRKSPRRDRRRSVDAASKLPCSRQLYVECSLGKVSPEDAGQNILQGNERVLNTCRKVNASSEETSRLRDRSREFRKAFEARSGRNTDSPDRHAREDAELPPDFLPSAECRHPRDESSVQGSNATINLPIRKVQNGDLCTTSNASCHRGHSNEFPKNKQNHFKTCSGSLNRLNFGRHGIGRNAGNITHEGDTNGVTAQDRKNSRNCEKNGDSCAKGDHAGDDSERNGKEIHAAAGYRGVQYRIGGVVSQSPRNVDASRAESDRRAKPECLPNAVAAEDTRDGRACVQNRSAELWGNAKAATELECSSEFTNDTAECSLDDFGQTDDKYAKAAESVATSPPIGNGNERPTEIDPTGQSKGRPIKIKLTAKSNERPVETDETDTNSERRSEIDSTGTGNKRVTEMDPTDLSKERGLEHVCYLTGALSVTPTGEVRGIRIPCVFSTAGQDGDDASVTVQLFPDRPGALELGRRTRIEKPAGKVSGTLVISIRD